MNFTVKKNILFIINFFICFAIYSQGNLFAQLATPFQIPKNNNEQEIYDKIDYYNFSALAFDSKNRPYGFNIHEEFGYVRTFRNGLWVKRYYFDELKKQHPGVTIKNAHTANGHHEPRVSITSDDHLYITLNYLAGEEKKWAILYLDDLDTEDFQVEVLSGEITTVTVEQFTGHNLKNNETPGILVTEMGTSFASLGWPGPTVSWTIGNVHVVKFLIPYRNENGTIEFNTTVLGTRLGNTTIHSGGDGVMATIGNKTFVTYSGFDEKRIETKATRNRVNRGYLAEVIRPTILSGSTSIKKRFMGVQSVYGHIDSHSQGAIVVDAEGRLHYLSGNHAAADEYYRSLHPVSGNDFDFKSDLEWKKYGNTTPKGDFSYDTPVIDNNNTIYFAYRQRNAGPERGLYVKSAPTNTTDWGDDLGELIVRPPAPWSNNGEYIIFYHRFIMDRAGNVHLSSGFFEFENYEKGNYPRIGIFLENGRSNWQMSSRSTYLKNMICEN